jgi:hypothetical protein
MYVMCICAMWEMWYFLFSATGGNCGLFLIRNRLLLGF